MIQRELDKFVYVIYVFSYNALGFRVFKMTK